MKGYFRSLIGPGWYIILILALSNIGIHLLFHANFEYHRDELLYFSLAYHPDFGYASVPPLTGWIALMMKTLFGTGLFAVKLFPAILSGLFTILLCLIVKELGGKLFAQILVAVVILFIPFTLRSFHLFQPVANDIFLWTLLLYFVIKYFQKEETQFLYIAGVVFGIGLLNKYLIIVLFLALCLSFLITDKRKIFSEKKFYFAGFIALLIFLPNLIWQFTHGIPALGHVRELSATQLVYVNPLSFLKDQLIMPFTGTLLTIPGIYFLLKRNTYRYLGLCALMVIILLLLLRGKSYYTLGIFPLLMAAGAVAWEKWLTKGWLRYSLLIFFVLISIPILPFGIPTFKQDKMVQYFDDLEKDYGVVIGRTFEDGSIHSLPQDYADQLGWFELANITKEAFDQVQNKANCVIYCENYGQAGAIVNIARKWGLPEPVSFSDSFYYWAPRTLDEKTNTLIYVNDELGDDIQELFSDIKKIGSIENVHAREYGTAVYLCQNPRRPLPEFWAERMAEFDD